MVTTAMTWTGDTFIGELSGAARTRLDRPSSNRRTDGARSPVGFDTYVNMLGTLALQGHRPNLLVVVGRGLDLDATARRMITLCVLPLHWCALPGPLALPPARTGTLFLNDVAALTRAQQIALFDWLGQGCEHLQTISLTSLPLEQLVEDGQFLEGLYYRLNVVRLDVTR